jgi:signal peptide peptidase SppA
MKMSKNQVSELFFNQPLAINEEMIGPISAVIDRHMEGVKLSDLEIDAAIGRSNGDKKTYEVINGVAVIPITGVISKRMNMFSRISGGTSIELLQKDFLEAIEDPQVEKIAFDIDSPGGSVGGVPEMADLVYASRGKKPIESYVDGQMCSAAYWIGSAADRVYVTKSSVVGSIGVYTVAKDYTVMDHNRGVRSEVIRAGVHKATGHPDKRLSTEDIGVIQARINDFYELFVEAVAKNRGISMEQAYALADGTVSIGRKSVDAGFADGMKTLESLTTGDSSSSIYGRVGDDPLNIDANQDKSKDKKGDMNMGKEIKDLTVADLKTQNPELLKAIQEQTANDLISESEKGEKLIDEAVTEERGRCQSIYGLLKTKEYASYGDLAHQCVSDGCDFEAAEKKFMAQRLEDLEAKSPETPGPGNPDPETPKGESNAEKEKDPQKAHLARAEAYRKENGGTMTDALLATADKR